MSRPYAHESVFRAVADSTRRRVVELLLRGERSASEIAASLGVTRPTLSHHLAILEVSGVIGQRRAGRRRLYSLRPQQLRSASHWFRRCENGERR